jgi:hypothetical protein
VKDEVTWVPKVDLRGNEFFVKARQEADLTVEEEDLLREADIRTADDLFAIIEHFPELEDRSGVDVQKLAAYSANYLSTAVMSVMAPNGKLGPPVTYPYGALDPDDPVFHPSSGSPAPPLGGKAIALASVDVDLPNWPIRGQGLRGTCVAHSLAACVEHRMLRTNPSAPHDISEQFLYWASKQRDGYPTVDGTWLQFAADALRLDGACSETRWHYDPSTRPNIHHGPPPSTAVSAAGGHRYSSTYYRTTSMHGKAAAVHAELAAGNVVAASLPVFAYPNDPSNTNWNQLVGRLYGIVVPPLRGTRPVGGHAICITGFVADATEPSGGYFLFRNSWDLDWATSVPATSSGRYVVKKGYGQMGASYLDRYLWEQCSI